VETSYLVNTLFLVGLGLLGLVSLGILYVSAAQWRDRRRQDRDKRGGY
jgi:CHASE1-domain containing sensor protein